MPKVSEDYFDKKKQSIVDAAYRVCLKKPVEMVTMTDVIEETGLSQGGIYRFYKDLDEILSDLVTSMRRDYNIIDDFEALGKEADNLSFNEAIYRFCDILGEAMEAHLMDIQKINFDLTVLAINEPDRAEKIIGGTKGRGNMEYMAQIVLPLLMKASEENHFVLKGTPEELFDFISSAYVGIEMNCILSACYGRGKTGSKANPRQQFKTLAKTIIFLFGSEE